MIELKVSIDHLTAYSYDPPGVLVLTRHTEGDQKWVTVKRADPEVQFTDELLTDFAGGGDNDGMYPGVQLEPPPGEPPPEPTTWEEWHDHEIDAQPCCFPGRCFVNWLVRIPGRDRTVVYRVIQYVADRNTWIARWPD